MGNCCARENNDGTITMVPERRDPQFTTIRMPMSPSYKQREQQKQELLMQQQRTAPYSQGMGSRPGGYSYSRPPHAHTFDPLGPTEGGAVRPQPDPSYTHQGNGASLYYSKPPSGYSNGVGYGQGTPAQQHNAASGQYYALDSPHDFATMHIETKELLEGQESSPGLGADPVPFKPRPSFVPPLPLKEKGIEGQYGSGQ